MQITHDYFLTEWHGFREIMCSAKHTCQQKFDAYEGLLRAYFSCKDENAKDRETAMRMLQVEFPMRLGLEEVMKLERLFLQMKLADGELGVKNITGGKDGN